MAERQLSPRLEAVLAAVLPCKLLADVGTDHGLVPIAAVQRGLAVRAIAADLRAAPLALAQRNVERAGLEDRVSILRGDGLHALPRVDCVVLAGMSGTLMARICGAGAAALAGAQRIVAQPNTCIQELREWAIEHAWHLQDERVVEDAGRFFTVCVLGRVDTHAYAVPGWSRADLLRVGPLLLARRDPTALRHYRMHHARIGGLPTSPQLAAELAMWAAACAYCEGVG